MEKKEDKRWSWLFLLTLTWPQWRFLKVIRLLHKKDQTAEKEKKKLLTSLGGIEALVESVPSIMIMTLICWQATDNITEIVENYNEFVQCSSSQVKEQWQKNFCAVFDGFGGVYWFFTSYGISILTGSLGVVKVLQHGPCPILSESGRLGGMATGKFFFAYVSVLGALLTKGIFAGIVISFANEFNKEKLFFTTLFVVANILPNLAMAIVLVAIRAGFRRTIMNIIPSYPGIVALPTFTYFLIGPSRISNCLVDTKTPKTVQLIVSNWMTIMNIVLSVLCYGIIIAIILYSCNPGDDFDLMVTYFLTIFLPILLFGILMNILFIVFDKQLCCGIKFDQNTKKCIQIYTNTDLITIQYPYDS